MEQVVKVPKKQLHDNEYILFRDFLEQQCGIVLGSNKLYLVKSRLAPLMTKFEVNTLSELINLTLKPTQRLLRAAVVDAMTTNETLWFRDGYPFDLFKHKVLPELFANKPSIRVWSAASSSGQEPYSLAMTAAEYQGMGVRKKISILGTDISNTMLNNCKSAQYDQLALGRGLSAERKRKFFDVVGHPRDGVMKVKDDIRNMTSFRHLNLLDNYSLLGKFDVIFCRNVLIYFSSQLKSQIINKFADSLNDEGYLFLGASESIAGISDRFKMIRCNPGIIYQKK